MTISLAKGQKINLAKDNGSSLTKIYMGLGWDVAKKTVTSKGFLGMGGGTREVEGDPIDLDASVVAYDANKRRLATVFFGDKRAFNDAIVHQGDNLTGEGDGDDEVINVDLSRLPANVDSLVFTVNSFRNQTFDQVANASCRLVDETTDKEMARIDLSAKGNHTGVIMARVYRQGNGWALQSFAEVGQGRTFQDMLPQIERLF